MRRHVKIAIKRLFPRSLLGRSLLIIVTPLVLLQVVSAFIFFETHWETVSLRLARGVAGDIAAVIALLERHPEPGNRGWISDLASSQMSLVVRFKEGEELLDVTPVDIGGGEGMLLQSLGERVQGPFRIDGQSLDRHVIVDVARKGGVLEVIVPRKRLFSATTYVFVLWMVGTSLLLFALATIFMRNQVKPIRRLAIAADNFGKGRDVPSFKPEGAKEVRQAATAFLAMRERILRQIRQRTEMLAGVSHDLRTPLTRLRLQLEMSGDSDDVRDMKADISEMEHMLESYLAFARGEGSELPQPTNLNELLTEVASQARRKGGIVDIEAGEEIVLPLRPHAIKRCVTNLIDNATRYASRVAIHAQRSNGVIEVFIDDDGPGIPAEKRDDVFKPFIRLDGSRKPGTGGTGLGLTIARDVVRGHGGDIELDASPSGGLRAKLWLPM